MLRYFIDNTKLRRKIGYTKKFYVVIYVQQKYRHLFPLLFYECLSKFKKVTQRSMLNLSEILMWRTLPLEARINQDSL